MAALNFPASPTIGDTYLPGNGVTYTWDGVSWNAKLGSLSIATAAQWLNDTPGLVLGTDPTWTAAGPVSLTDATTIAVDMSTFINATVTLGGNRTLGNPTNTKNGQTGAIEILQDATGSRTLAFASNWKFQGGTAPTLSTAANARDMLFYYVDSSSVIVGSLLRGVA
jgi:hypothetical protein